MESGILEDHAPEAWLGQPANIFRNDFPPHFLEKPNADLRGCVVVVNVFMPGGLSLNTFSPLPPRLPPCARVWYSLPFLVFAYRVLSRCFQSAIGEAHEIGH
uniref:Uncharacterized protein n=1 Tax=Sphaerodactylus townsendi TaxID=933632 RepID=A0ACB8EMT1_9SAUR